MADYVVPDETISTHKGGLGNMPQPYKGTAPAPRAASAAQAADLGLEQRVDVALAGVPGNAVVMQAPASQVLATDTMPSQLGATPAPTGGSPPAPLASPPPGMQTSPPPASPTEAAALAALRSQVGSLVQALHEKDRSWEQQMAEMRFNLEAAQASKAPVPQATYALPDGVDPTRAPTWGELNTALGYLVPNLNANAQAQAIRATWGVSQAEETEALASYPVLASIQTEPARTQKTLEAVRLLRARSAPARPTPASASASQPPPVTRPAAPTVPHTEYTSAPTMNDAPAPGALELAVAEFNVAEASIRTARNDAERKERLAALRRASERLKAAQGITDEMERTSSFHIRG
jgi:hypothetical protein